MSSGSSSWPKSKGVPVLGPVHAMAFVGAEQDALAFLPRIPAALAIGDGRQVAPHRRDLGDVLGDQVMMFDRHQGQGDAGLRRHLARPQASGVHHVFASDRPVRRCHLPVAGRQLPRRRHRRVAQDAGAEFARGAGKGVGGAGRIDIALFRLIERGDQPVGVEHRNAPSRFFQRNELGRNTVPLAAALQHFQLDVLVGRLGHRHAAATVIAHRLLGFFLDHRVEVAGVLLQHRCARRRCQRKQAAGRVPRRPGGELLPLDQHAVRPARLGEVVEDGASGHAATDDDHAGLGDLAHGDLLPAPLDANRSITLRVMRTIC